MCEDLGGLFSMAPSIGGVCLVTITQKRVLVEPGAMQEADTWSRSIFFQCVKTWQYIVVVCFEAETGKQVVTAEP